MLPSQHTIDQIAGRIERAYRRKYPRSVMIGVMPGVWASAASRLLETSETCRGLPIDPELFVAVQVGNRLTPDPWVELTQRGSVNRYLKALRRIIKRLRAELRSEVRRAENRLRQGMPIDLVLETERSRISPLSCYILALRAGRDDLSSKHRESALRQHASCPLYQIASSSLLSNHSYPTGDLRTSHSQLGHETVVFSLN